MSEVLARPLHSRLDHHDQPTILREKDVKTGLDEADHGEVFYEYVLLLIYSVLGIRFGLKHVIMPLLTKE